MVHTLDGLMRAVGLLGFRDSLGNNLTESSTSEYFRKALGGGSVHNSCLAWGECVSSHLRASRMVQSIFQRSGSLYGTGVVEKSQKPA